jgi:hypothetical protein
MRYSLVNPFPALAVRGAFCPNDDFLLERKFDDTKRVISSREEGQTDNTMAKTKRTNKTKQRAAKLVLGMNIYSLRFFVRTKTSRLVVYFGGCCT